MTLDINIVGCEEDIAEIQRRYDVGDPVAKFLIDNSSIRQKPDCRKCKHDRSGTEHRLCDSYEVCMYEKIPCYDGTKCTEDKQACGLCKILINPKPKPKQEQHP